MYQPYIRGKQFELIGIRDLTSTVLVPNIKKVSPIIEPVKDSSTLKTTLKMLVAGEVNFTVVINPQVGNFNNSDDILSVIKECLGDYKNYQVGIIFHKDINHQTILNSLRSYSEIISSLSIIHNIEFENIREVLASYSEQYKIKYNVLHLSLTGKRYFRNFQKETLIELDDYFNSQTKNADYLKVDESDFSEEHLFYKEDGFEGFSDYLSIGEEYSESGFLPYAVAIHLSYAEKGTNKIKIKHFVSDSNDDTSDIGGKFEQALNKLIAWCDKTGYNSVAIPEFRNFHKNGHFPGLGTLKKLSLMNHIDLVLNLI
ncbi:MAG: sce7725 family protein [Chryseobacterium culicis]